MKKKIVNILLIIFWNCFSTFSLNILPSEPAINIKINLTNATYNKVNFYEEILLSANTYKVINLHLENQDLNFGFIILQVHSYAYDITFSVNKTIEKFQHQNGTNLGYLLTKSGEFYIYNFNQHIDCNLALNAIVYNNLSPLPGGCNLEDNVTQSPILHLTLSKEMIIIDTPSAGLSIIRDHNQEFCNITKQDLSYQPLYNFLPKNDFTKRTYFDGIKKLLEVNNSLVNGLKTFKSNPPGPANRRTYIAIPGTGMVFNTIVKSSDGEAAAYIPTVTYSCQPWMWENGCTIIRKYKTHLPSQFRNPNFTAQNAFLLNLISEWTDSALMKILSYLLIIIGCIKIFVFFAEPYASLFLNCIPLGSYIVYRLIVNYDISPEIRSTILILSGLIFAILVVSIVYCCGPISFIFRFISSCLFSWIISVNLVYLFESNLWTTNDVVYQTIFWLSVIALLIITTKSFKFIWSIVNNIIGAYAMLVGLQIVTKSNLLIVFSYHFNRISIKNYGYVDGAPGPDKSDIWLIVAIIGIFFLGMIFKKNRFIVYGQNTNRDGYENIDRQPIITRWTHGSDDVFESPSTNHNFFRRMARSPLWA